MTWVVPAKNWKGFLKRFEVHLKIFQSQKLYATQWVSWEKIKWLLQMLGKRVGSFKEIENPFEIISNLELFDFYSNYFSPKIKYMENRGKWFPRV